MVTVTELSRDYSYTVQDKAGSWHKVSAMMAAKVDSAEDIAPAILLLDTEVKNQVTKVVEDILGASMSQ
jgi:hypothetical protein